MRMNPPPDSDKPMPVPTDDNSCWIHTASNMLAGAGYGNGATVQARADDIWADMSPHYITSSGGYDGGWIDAALQWWLGSTNNTWPGNPYTVVTVYGNKSPAFPWANTNGARDIGNELRTGNLVGLSISWPSPFFVGQGGHAITAWGDANPSIGELTVNPIGVRIADSDVDTGGDVQAYLYDDYNNPNPGGETEGPGWYFDYQTNHPYIKHITTLSPTRRAAGPNAVRATGCYQVQQTSAQEASGLHYRVGSDVEILSYRTWIDWVGGPPVITEDQQHRELSVDWDLSGKKVPRDTWITICTDLVELDSNAVSYQEVHFTYPDGGRLEYPDLAWKMETPVIAGAEKIPNVTGGYVIGNFDVYNFFSPGEPVVRYRFVHQYLYNQSPEAHTLKLSGTPGFLFTSPRITHSYGYPAGTELWQIEKFMTVGAEKIRLSDKAVLIPIDWKGKLPYPQGDGGAGENRWK